MQLVRPSSLSASTPHTHTLIINAPAAALLEMLLTDAEETWELELKFGPLGDEMALSVDDCIHCESKRADKSLGKVVPSDAAADWGRKTWAQTQPWAVRSSRVITVSVSPKSGRSTLYVNGFDLSSTRVCAEYWMCLRANANSCGSLNVDNPCWSQSVESRVPMSDFKSSAILDIAWGASGCRVTTKEFAPCSFVVKRWRTTLIDGGIMR
jgi:hypothetical protein